MTHQSRIVGGRGTGSLSSSNPSKPKRRAAGVLGAAALAAAAGLFLRPPGAHAASLYWDINGTSGGSGDGTGNADGTWDNAVTNWNTDSTGTTTTVVWAPGSLAIFSAGTDVTNTANVTVLGTQSISGMTIEEGTINLIGAGNFTLTGTTATFNVATTGSITNAISGSSAFTKTGSGTLTLSGANAMTGATTTNTTVSGGTLVLDYSTNNNDKINAAGTLTLSNAALNIVGSAAGSTSQAVASTSLSANSGSTITLTTGLDQNATLDLGAITRGTNATLNINKVNSGTGVASVLSTNTNTNGIIGGYVTFNGSDWISGDGTTLTPFTAYDVDDYTATKNVDAQTNQTVATDSTFNSLRFNTPGVTATLQGSNNVISSGGILVTANAGGSKLTGGSVTSGGGDLIVHQNNTGGDFELASDVTGTVGLTKSGLGNLRLTGANTNTGPYTINSGTVTLGVANTIPDTAPVVVNALGTIDLNGQTETIGSLSGAGLVSEDFGAIVTGQANTNTTFSGVMAHLGDLTKVGSGNFTITSLANTYQGTTNINAGIVTLSASGVTNAKPLGDTATGTVVASGAALQVTGAAQFGAEPLTLNGTGIGNTGALRKTANNTTTYTGNITLNTTGTRINSDSGTLRLTGTISGNGDPMDVQLGGAGTISLAGAVQGNIGKIRYDGTGTLILAATNNLNTSGIIATSGTVQHAGYSGGSQGTIGDNFGAVSTTFVPDFIQLSGGAILKSTKTGQGATAIQGNRGIQLGVGGGKWDDPLDNPTTNVHIYRGLISGTGPFTKQGGGILAITGNNTYSGATFINGGVLRLRTDSSAPSQPGPGSLPSGTPLTVAAAATFDLNVNPPGNLQVVGSLNGAGGICAPSGSVTTLSMGGDNTNATFSGSFSTFSNTGIGAAAATALKITKTGTGVQVFSGTSTTNLYTGVTTISGGVLRAADGGGLPTASPLTINAGIYEPNAQTTFIRALGTAAGNVQLTGGTSGFGAFGSPLFVDLGGNGTGTGAGITWGDATFNPSTLVLNGSTANSTLTLTNAVNLGANTVSRTIQVSNNIATLGGVISSSGTTGLIKTGSGTLVLTNPSIAYTGNTTVSAGTLVLFNSLTTSSGVSVNAGLLQLPSDGSSLKVIHTPTVSVTNPGRLDIADNKLITGTAVGTLVGVLYSGVTGMIQSGRNGGAWNGIGIITSQSTAASGNFTTLGVASAQQVKGLATTTDTAVWAGQTVTGSETLAMYTYGGDANLDGKINVDDYGRIDFNVNLGTSGWFNGDFNYDGKINVDDYGIIDFNVGIQGAPFPTAGGAASSSGLSGVSAVPEPASLSLLSLGAAALLGGRRRRRRRDA